MAKQLYWDDYIEDGNHTDLVEDLEYDLEQAIATICKSYKMPKKYIKYALQSGEVREGIKDIAWEISREAAASDW